MKGDWTHAWQPMVDAVGRDFGEGRTEVWGETIEASMVRRYIEPLELDSKLHSDAAFARAHGYADIVVPSTAIASFAMPLLWNPGDSPLFDDAAETIRHLRERGIKVAVSSNNFQELVDRFVDKAGIAFDLVCGFREGFAKGEDHFAYIERRFGLPRGQIAFVGDSLKDGDRAAASGVAFIGKTGIFTRGQFAERFPEARVIERLSELKGIVG